MADVNVTITIPDAWVNRTLDAFNGMADKQIGIDFENAHKRYSYLSKETEENNLQFGERVMIEMIKQHIKVYELSIDNTRYSDEIQAILQPFEDVPNDILT